MPKKLTTEGFIAKAISIHGNKYDYSKVVYTTMRTKVCIICDKHGNFWQTPDAHTHNQGCPKCGKCTVSTKLSDSLDTFITKANIKHNNKYTYCNFVYTKSFTRGVITCEEHGDFLQTPSSHLQGAGCPACANNDKSKLYASNNTQFIVKANKKHNNKYIYDDFVYKNSHTKSIITCPLHGSFYQSPASHLAGSGCIKCSSTYIKDTSCVIENFQKIHGSLYDYSRVIYEGANKKVNIICSHHGIFRQTPQKHRIGQGCPKCNKSFGERIIASVLDSLNESYETQKTFSDLIHIKPLSFDFYILRGKIAIEFDGEQHFRPIKYFGGDERFKQIIARDKIKTNYCKEKGIRLIRIPYWDINNIPSILENHFIKINSNPDVATKAHGISPQ